MYTLKASLLGLIILFTTTLHAQTDCNCSKLFSSTVQKVKENYIGYQLTKDKIGEAYLQHIKKFEHLTANASEDSCTFLLQDFLHFFKDGHLFVTEIPNYSADELQKVKNQLQQKKKSIESSFKIFSAAKNSIHSIEGLWTDGSSKFAVIKNNDPSLFFKYIATIVQHTDTAKLGEIKFGLNERDGKLEGLYYTSVYSSRYLSVDLVKAGTLLSLSGGFYWGRLAFTDQVNALSVPVYNPTLPTVSKMNEETVMISIPSFLIEKKQLDEVLLKNSELITTAKNLVIDIRGNTGGNGIYSDMMRLYAEKPLISDTGLALASADNIAYFERFAGGKKNNLYGAVAEEMKGNIGMIVTGPQYQPRKISAVPSKIEKVIILTDKANASAAESFILSSKQVSSKVITIGQATSGTIDYQSVNMVKLGCDKKGIYFGYPTATSTKLIPAGGYNVTGIKPDILTPKTGDDLLVFVNEYLRENLK
jgi:Peptidase family S41